MNTDEIKVLKNLDKSASNSSIKINDIREAVWAKIEAEVTVIEIDSFRYIAVACAVAALIMLFFSTDILTSIQNTAAWEITEQTVSVF